MRLAEIATYVNEKISSSNITLDQYVTTDSLLQDKRGRECAQNLPPVVTNLTHYQPGDVFLLCTDGLYGKLNDGELWDILEVMQESEQDEMEEVAAQMIDSVKFRGEVDNITSYYIKVIKNREGN